jgi:thymidylate synthase
VEGFKENRLLNIIEKINLWDHNIASSLYAHTDIPADSLRTRGSPCLQYVQFRVFDGDRVGVTGLYRSHDYLSKALGNMVGLQRLARFVAQQTGRKFGQVTVISLAPIAEGGKGKLRQYVNRVAELQGI